MLVEKRAGTTCFLPMWRLSMMFSPIEYSKETIWIITEYQLKSYQEQLVFFQCGDSK